MRWPAIRRREVFGLPLFDVVLAAALVTLSQIEVWVNPAVPDPRWLQASFFVLATLPVAARRVAPLAVLAVVAAAVSAQAVLVDEAPVVSGFLAAVIATYSVAAQPFLWRAVAGAAVLVLALAAEPVLREDSRSFGDVLGNLVVFAAVWVLGRAVGELRRRGMALEDRASSAEQTAEEQARRAVEEERERIARELHDVVAYSVSLMVLQAGAARQLLDASSRARGPLLTVEETGRQALEEMHRMLTVLRRSNPADREPLGNLEQLPVLVRQVREAGLDVELTVQGERRPLPAGLELAGYRIVQESLTNVMKHAEGTAVTVRVDYRDSELLVEVTDDGHGEGAPLPGSGHGLLGLRERAELYGGSLQAGPRPEGGFSVNARLPLSGVAS